MEQCGGDRNRTGVQTLSSKAFYMLSSALFVGKAQEPNKPTPSVAVWYLNKGHSLLLSQPVFVLCRRLHVITGGPVRSGPNDYLITD